MTNPRTAAEAEMLENFEAEDRRLSNAEPLRAFVTRSDDLDGSSMLRIGRHHIQLGGRDGDGYCYGCQSFWCVDHLTALERAAADSATDISDVNGAYAFWRESHGGPEEHPLWALAWWQGWNDIPREYPHISGGEQEAFEAGRWAGWKAR